MKKLFIIILTVALMLSAVGCVRGGTGDDGSGTTLDTQSREDTTDTADTTDTKEETAKTDSETDGDSVNQTDSDSEKQTETKTETETKKETQTEKDSETASETTAKADRPTFNLVTSITLDKDNIVLKKGEVAYLTATMLPADADDLGISWSTDELYIAKISRDSAWDNYSRIKISTLELCGTVTVTARVLVAKELLTATCTVTVIEADGEAE